MARAALSLVSARLGAISSAQSKHMLVRRSAARLAASGVRCLAVPPPTRVSKSRSEEQGVTPVGSGVPIGTPREDWKKYGYSTRCASVVKVSDYAIRRVKPVSLPIVLGSTFELDDARHGARLHEKREAPYADGDGYVYGRWGSPTNEGAARQLAALEGIGPESEGGCMLFSSGMAAITGALMAALKAGDHAVFPYAVYGGTHEFLCNYAEDWGIEYSLVDATDPSEYAKAMRPNTRVIYTETPANPTCRLTDLPAIAAIADAHAAAGRPRPLVMCDGTFATPYHQRVLEIPGIDVAIHSATKYIGGHSDILAGAVTCNDAEYVHALAKVSPPRRTPRAVDRRSPAFSTSPSRVRRCRSSSVRPSPRSSHSSSHAGYAPYTCAWSATGEAQCRRARDLGRDLLEQSRARDLARRSAVCPRRRTSSSQRDRWRAPSRRIRWSPQCSTQASPHTRTTSSPWECSHLAGADARRSRRSAGCSRSLSRASPTSRSAARVVCARGSSSSRWRSHSAGRRV